MVVGDLPDADCHMLPQIVAFAFRLRHAHDLFLNGLQPTIQLLFQGRFNHCRPSAADVREDLDALARQKKTPADRRPVVPRYIRRGDLP